MWRFINIRGRSSWNKAGFPNLLQTSNVHMSLSPIWKHLTPNKNMRKCGHFLFKISLKIRNKALHDKRKQNWTDSRWLRLSLFRIFSQIAAWLFADCCFLNTSSGLWNRSWVENREQEQEGRPTKTQTPVLNEPIFTHFESCFLCIWARVSSKTRHQGDIRWQQVWKRDKESDTYIFCWRNSKWGVMSSF